MMPNAERVLWLAALVLLLWRMIAARHKAERVDGLRKTMAEAIIHDLKNPMTSVMAGIACSLEEGTTAAQRTRLLAIALAGCKSQMTLLETLVDTGRIESGELFPRLERVSTGDLLARCLDDVRSSARHLKVELDESRTKDLPVEITVDPDLFARAVMNLLHNALKYTPAGGTVALSAQSSGGEFRFTVSDTGVGIPPEHIGRLFQKYYRVEGTVQADRRGSGLGLYFCRMVVEAHGGRISVASATGTGTTVSFNIPCPSSI